MRIRKLTLQHFRNIPLASLELQGRQQFFIGSNGQGKTNLLEAAGFLTALRSFRTTDAKLLVAHGQNEAGIACELEHEQRGETRVTVRLKSTGREVWCDQEPVTRLGDYLGKFPTVVFSSQDLQLLRGAPTGRRRWMDLTLAAIDPAYLKALQTYTRALADRNSLLKRGPGGAGDKEIAAFEHMLAPVAAELIARRSAGLAELNTLVQAAYGRIADQAEPTSLGYDPDFAGSSAEMILEKMAASRARDAQFRTTLTGPHRDDVELKISGRVAKDFASEGQQRSLVLALRVAQAAWFHQKSGIRPVLLADDVLGELDPERRRRFWTAIDPESQMIATGTVLPDATLGHWQVFKVSDGTFQPVEGAGDA